MTAGLVREQEAGLEAFLSHDGFSVLMRGMQSDSEKLRTKSAFLLLNLLTANPEQKGTDVFLRNLPVFDVLFISCQCQSVFSFICRYPKASGTAFRPSRDTLKLIRVVEDQQR